MYPLVRMIKELAVHRKDAPLVMGDAHVSRHICWPWDLDFLLELNNGRTLTLYDLGRIPMARRMGLIDVLRTRKWGYTIAGSSVRYRRRIRMFQKFEMRSRTVGWDDRFIYLDQSMWRDGQCLSQALYRSAVTDKNGIVSPRDVAEAMAVSPDSPPLPEWVQNWSRAEDTRPWPPKYEDGLGGLREAS